MAEISHLVPQKLFEFGGISTISFVPFVASYNHCVEFFILSLSHHNNYICKVTKVKRNTFPDITTLFFQALQYIRVKMVETTKMQGNQNYAAGSTCLKPVIIQPKVTFLWQIIDFVRARMCVHVCTFSVSGFFFMEPSRPNPS